MTPLPMTRTYRVTALEMPIYYNAVRLDTEASCRGNGNGVVLAGGDHDHNGLMYALTDNVPILTYLRTLINNGTPTCEEREAACARAAALCLPPLPTTPEKARLPHPLVRPLVLRACLDETVKVHLCNQIPDRRVGMHLVAEGYDVKVHDGALVGNNPEQVGGNPVNLAPTGKCVEYQWVCTNEGVFVFHDGGNFDGLKEDNEDPEGHREQKGSSNLHGLFGALAVEPPGAIWRDPVTGLQSMRKNASSGKLEPVELDGLYMDILFALADDPGCPPYEDAPAEKTPEDGSPSDGHEWPGEPVEYPCFNKEAHREFVVVFHDEPEFVPPHGDTAPDPCLDCADPGHGGSHGGGGHAGVPPIMPISYRAEPMVNRERELLRLLCENPKHFGDRPVLNEEQHHSSWMFGDPATPILKAYIGDPVRIRLVHGGVKETHVFHLHLYEWHAAPQDQKSPRIDAISFSPQTGHTIEPVWGAGNRHQVPGDVIWHCHLYPHFHEGMWGIFRTFETLQKGCVGEPLCIAEDGSGPSDDEQDDVVTDAVYKGRHIGRYPDGTRIERLLPLPDRPQPPKPTPRRPGFPLFIPGRCRQKSPRPPWPDREYKEGEEVWCDLPSLLTKHMPSDFDYRPRPTHLERAAFNARPLPGEMFTYNMMRDQQEVQWQCEGWTDNPKGSLYNGPREECPDIGVTNRPILYNHDQWVDPKGHFYYLKEDGSPSEGPKQREPLFFRARHGQIVNVVLDNLTAAQLEEDDFDHALPPCDARPWQGECAAHVHMVKFDPICGDGASTGWNYMSGARNRAGDNHRTKMVYRWWLDQEFGTIFFHDHLFANYRQKRGLFGALLVEPAGSEFYSNFEDKPIVSGLQARIFLPGRTAQSQDTPAQLLKTERRGNWVREFCLALADFIPLYDRFGNPLNPPHAPGGHGDQGVMAINYRNEPITLRARDHSRSKDPARWFSSYTHGDPATTGFATFEDDPIWFRLLQGSHEEQHSFQIHAMRWLRFRVNTGSALRNQQTFGIAEAFTFAQEERYGPGDYLYKLSGADDLWLGCWGLIRAFPKSDGDSPQEKELAECPEDRASAPSGTAEGRGSDEPIAPHPRQDQIPKPIPLESVKTPPKLYEKGVRRFKIEAVERRLFYRRAGSEKEADIVDPFGLVYRVLSVEGPDEQGEMKTTKIADSVVGNGDALLGTDPVEPLVIRCREGETVEVTLYNNIRNPDSLAVEPHSPLVPLDDTKRKVSPRVSLHADLVLYDVLTSDGASVGQNPYQTVPPGCSITYVWETGRPLIAPGDRGEPSEEANGGWPLGPVLLQDMADFRHHRHHGLVGALIVEARDAKPKAVLPGETTAAPQADEAWHGARATITTSTVAKPIEEMVLLMQDGLRLYWNGDTRQPLNDPPDEEEGGVDYEDQGQKGFNYGSEPRGPHFDTRGRPDLPPHEWLRTPTPTPSPWPATPLWHVSVHSCVHLHLIGACDKPRNHSFTLHGVAWPEFRFPREDQSPERCPDREDHFKVAAESAVTSGTVRTFRFSPEHDGDHAYRSGLLRWDVPQGLWGILRVEPAKP